jgi:hypothetical protein
MSAPEIPVDVGVLREEIRKTYTEVSTDTERDFIFPTGRTWAQELGYPEPELARPRRHGRELRRCRQPLAAGPDPTRFGRARPRLRRRHRPADRRPDDRPVGPRHRRRHDPINARARARSSKESTRACWSSGHTPTSPRKSSSTPTRARRSRTPGARPPSTGRWARPSAPSSHNGDLPRYGCQRLNRRASSSPSSCCSSSSRTASACGAAC